MTGAWHQRWWPFRLFTAPEGDEAEVDPATEWRRWDWQRGTARDPFVRVWEKAPQYQSKGKPLSWILAIAKNLSLMKLREQGKQQDLEPQEWESLAIDSPDVTWEDRQILQAALNRLSREEQQVVMLHAVAGMRHREIASLLDMPLPTVLSKYHRALKKLNTSLKGDEER